MQLYHFVWKRDDADLFGLVPVYNFEKPSCKQSATPRPPSERNESFSLRASKKETTVEVQAEKEGKRSRHKTS